jgi:hypothetical protein
MGSWKIIAIAGPMSRRRFAAGIGTRSTPSNRIRPESTSTPLGSRPAIARSVSDLPEPDSPTMPKRSPSRISKDRSSTMTVGSPPRRRMPRVSRSTARSTGAGELARAAGVGAVVVPGTVTSFSRG